MSPEQAKGRPADKRSDIWAFGCVLYEMLTRKRAFVRTTDERYARGGIDAGDPVWDMLPGDTPFAIRRLLRRCLQKKTKHRLHAAADVRIEIEDALATPDAAVSASPVRSGRQSATLAWAVTAVAVVVAVTLALFPVRRAASDSPPFRLEVNTPPTSDAASFALSPDGRQLVFVATQGQGSQLWMRPLDQTHAEPLPGTEGASHPFWAPDNRALGFFANGQLRRLDLGGGRPQVLAEARNPMGGAWNSRRRHHFFAVCRQPAHACGGDWRNTDRRHHTGDRRKEPSVPGVSARRPPLPVSCRPERTRIWRRASRLA